MKKIFMLVVCSGILLAGCGNNPSQQGNADIEDSLESHQHDTQKIELNSGEKWNVNAEMKPFVIKGEELVSNFLKNNQSNYHELAGQLKEQNNHLIKSCTMEGKSHDELHKWLHPHLDLVKALESEQDTNEAARIVAALQTSYQHYHQYFN